MNDSEYQIKIVADNKEKGNSYKVNIERYNKAFKSEFYLECLWIIYAMLEDRTSTFLYYLGFTCNQDRNTATGSKKIKKEIRQIFNMIDKNAKYNFNTISGKLTRIADVIAWSKTVDSEKSAYQIAVKKAVKKLSEDENFLSALNYLNNEWRKKRNQLTHSLFNKDPDTVISELKPLLEHGYSAVRVIDNAVARLKKEKIRKRFNIQ